MLNLLGRFGLVLVSAVAMAVAPVAHGAQRLAKVSGGGTATFDFIEGLQSQFAIGATAYDDGSAQGHFVCMIVAVVTISGEVAKGSLNADGSVTFSGVGRGIDHVLGGPFEDCPFEVTLWSGGPGVGRFLYNDCVVPRRVTLKRCPRAPSRSSAAEAIHEGRHEANPRPARLARDRDDDRGPVGRRRHDRRAIAQLAPSRRPRSCTSPPRTSAAT